MGLPEAFCWTRVGSEAGQSLQSILARKEAERRANDGIFFWGIGNAIGPSLRALLPYESEPEVLFSPIKSRPRREDVHPTAVVAWTRAECLDGTPFELPAHALITSRLDIAAPKCSHYTLVCATDTPLTAERPIGLLDAGAIENLLTGRPIGASQVTAVVRRRERRPTFSRQYEIALQARLVPPFFLRLQEPILLPLERDDADWETVVTSVWATVLGRRRGSCATAQTRFPMREGVRVGIARLPPRRG
jgi:hypothetical protein